MLVRPFHCWVWYCPRICWVKAKLKCIQSYHLKICSGNTGAWKDTHVFNLCESPSRLRILFIIEQAAKTIYISPVCVWVFVHCELDWCWCLLWFSKWSKDTFVICLGHLRAFQIPVSQNRSVSFLPELNGSFIHMSASCRCEAEYVHDDLLHYCNSPSLKRFQVFVPVSRTRKRAGSLDIVFQLVSVFVNYQGSVFVCVRQINYRSHRALKRL